ncbi:proline-rich protein 19 isoform X2 [Echeneis naucrates]|uniref:proline-rich protein 19 isoform X2 n=1 Tax=Echeneis naucrates TaxID=173247 RepID=UPI0011142468|nr:proline-rich protein 19-like isoform X2 [Echeneis naucrates]
MSHTCGRVSSHNKKIFKFFNKQSGAKDKDCCLVNGSTAECQCPKQCKTDGQYNVKRLKTRRERSQVRGGGKETSKAKLHHHHCHPQTNKTHPCCHSSCHCPSLFSNVPPLNEPSVITDSRLIGHHGLFNHEVKSIDIERLLSEQRKLEKQEEEEPKQKHAVLRLSSSSCFPSPLCSNDLCFSTFEVVPLEKRADFSTNTHDECQEKDESSHGSDAVFHAGQPCCDNQKTTSFRIRGSSHFNWKAGQQPSRSLDQTAEWLSSPMDVSGRLLDDVLRPKHSSHFRMDFESSEASASDNLFIFSPNKYWPETTSAPQLWEDSFNKPSSKEWVSFDSYKGNIMYQSSGVTEEHCWLRRKDGNAQPFSYQAKMPHKRSVERMYIPQKEELFQPDRRSFSLPFPTHIHHHDQPNHFMPFSQLNPPADLMHYPPSHMLERCPAPPLSCLLSPEHWSFPPMKLY